MALRLVVSDAHQGLGAAVAKVLQELLADVTGRATTPAADTWDTASDEEMFTFIDNDLGLS